MRKRRHLSFWELAELIPPILARLLARKQWGRPLFDTEIATASGLTVDEVFLISHQTTWAQVDAIRMRQYLTGCGVDFCNHRQVDRVRAYLRHRPAWKYLRTSNEWKTRYEPLLRRYLKSVTQTPNPN